MGCRGRSVQGWNPRKCGGISTPSRIPGVDLSYWHESPWQPVGPCWLTCGRGNNVPVSPELSQWGPPVGASWGPESWARHRLGPCTEILLCKG